MKFNSHKSNAEEDTEQIPHQQTNQFKFMDVINSISGSMDKIVPPAPKIIPASKILKVSDDRF